MFVLLYHRSYCNSLFLKHNIGTEITKTIQYFQYLQGVQRIGYDSYKPGGQTFLLIILIKVQSFFKTDFRLFAISSDNFIKLARHVQSPTLTLKQDQYK